MGTDSSTWIDGEPLGEPLDALLTDVAVNIQLPPSLHATATERYEAVRNFAERTDSPLHGRIVKFYPQGSMAIDATISTRGHDDEYDLDIVAELDIDPATPSDEALDLLHRSLKGYPTSRRVERQTRCVTLRYADNMHLDVTPASRLPGGRERESHIFHANPAKPASEHVHVPMNAFGFAQWYNARTPLEQRFAKAFNRRLYEAYGYDIRAAADADDVPDQVPLVVKSTATVALQLLKRFRNIAYAESQGRIPPSVMLSCFAGQAAEVGLSLSDMVIRQARMVAYALDHATMQRTKIVIPNPIFPRDCFTDRWPETLTQQTEFAAKLSALADGLQLIKDGDFELERVQDSLRDWFGGYVVSKSVRQFNERIGTAVRKGSAGYRSKGGLYVPSAPAVVGATTVPATPARSHTFYGGQWR
jgi:hypothetical protein